MTEKNFYISKNSLQLELNPDGSSPVEVQLIPFGSIKGRDGRRFSMLSTSAVVANTIQRFNPSGNSDTLDLVIDYEHQTEMSEQNGAPAPAAGWIKQLIDRGTEGLWGIIDWTAMAAEFIKNKQYRYLSPVFTHDKQGNIIALLHAGLTNVPNLELKAFNTQNLNLKEKQEVNPLLKALCKALGLPETASDEEALAAVKELKEHSSAAASLNKIAEAAGASSADTNDILTAINKIKVSSVSANDYAALNKEVESLKEQIVSKEAETAVNKAVSDGMLPPALKEKGLSMYKTLGAAYFDDFIAGMPKVSVNKTEINGKAPSSGNDELTEGQMSLCKMMGVSAEDFKKTLKQENEDADI